MSTDQIMTIDNKFTRNKRKSNNHLPTQSPHLQGKLHFKHPQVNLQPHQQMPSNMQMPSHQQIPPNVQMSPNMQMQSNMQFNLQIPPNVQFQGKMQMKPEFHKNQGTYYFPNGEIFRPRISPARRNRPSKINYVPQVNNRPPMGQNRDMVQPRPHEVSPNGPIRNKSFPVPSSSHPELPRSQSSSNVKTQMFQQHLNHQLQMNQPGKLPQQYSSQYQQFQNLQQGHPQNSPTFNKQFQAPNGILPYEAYQQLSNNSSSTSLKNLQSNNLIKSSMNNSDPSLRKSTSSERSTTNTPQTSITNSIDEKYVEILRDDFEIGDIKEVKTPEPRSTEEFSPINEVFVTPNSSPVQSKISLDDVMRKNEEVQRELALEVLEVAVEDSVEESPKEVQDNHVVLPQTPVILEPESIKPKENSPESPSKTIPETPVNLAIPMLNDFPTSNDSSISSPNSPPESSPSPHSVEQVILLTPKKEFKNDQSSSSTVKSFPSPSSSQSYDDDLINEYRESPIKPTYKLQTFMDDKVEQEYTKLLEDEQQVPKRGDINFFEDRITKNTRVSLNTLKEEEDLPLPTIKYSDKELKLPKTPVDRDVESISSVEDTLVRPELMPVETESVYSSEEGDGEEEEEVEELTEDPVVEAVAPEAVATEVADEKVPEVPEKSEESTRAIVPEPEKTEEPKTEEPPKTPKTAEPSKPKSMLDVVDKPKPKSMLDVVDKPKSMLDVGVPSVKDITPKTSVAKDSPPNVSVTKDSPKSTVKASPKEPKSTTPDKVRDFKEKFKSKDIPLNLKLSPKKLNSISRLRKKPPSSSPLIERFTDQKKPESKLDLFLLPETSQKSKPEITQKSNSEKSLPSVPEPKTSKWKKVFKKSDDDDSKSVHSEGSKKDLKDKLKILKRSFSYKNLRLKKEEQPPLPDLSLEPDNLTSLEVLSSPENNLYNLDDMDVVLPTIETDDNLFDDMLNQFDEKLETVGRKNTIKPVKLIDPFLKDDELTKDQIKDQQIMDEEILTHHKNLSDEYIDDNLKYLKDEFVYLDNDMKSFNEVKSVVSEEEELVGGAEDFFTIDNEQLNNLFNNINDSQKRILPMHLRYIKQFKDFQQLEIKTKKFEILTSKSPISKSPTLKSPTLSKSPTMTLSKEPILKRNKTTSNKRVQFSNKFFVNETFSPDTYSRYNKKVTQYTLTEPVEIARIKNELNDYKCNEMLVHEKSQNNTHFFY